MERFFAGRSGRLKKSADRRSPQSNGCSYPEGMTGFLKWFETKRLVAFRLDVSERITHWEGNDIGNKLFPDSWLGLTLLFCLQIGLRQQTIDEQIAVTGAGMSCLNRQRMVFFPLLVVRFVFMTVAMKIFGGKQRNGDSVVVIVFAKIHFFLKNLDSLSVSLSGISNRSVCPNIATYRGFKLGEEDSVSFCKIVSILHL